MQDYCWKGNQQMVHLTAPPVPGSYTTPASSLSPIAIGLHTASSCPFLTGAVSTSPHPLSASQNTSLHYTCLNLDSMIVFLYHKSSGVGRVLHNGHLNEHLTYS